MNRRDFLKSIAVALGGLAAIPVPVFVPPRQPFVKMNLPGLDGIFSHF